MFIVYNIYYNVYECANDILSILAMLTNNIYYINNVTRICIICVLTMYCAYTVIRRTRST